MTIDFKTLPSNEMNGGIQYLFKAENSYGASIVQHDFSYGRQDGLWELAVIRFSTDDAFELVYHTPITDDVMGYLSESDVNDLLIKINALPND